ncbi:MAG: stage III sporulation protein AD [Clostridia bacterium]|nr:stage III sporulation protein AD [Clostridia bacterium]
MNIIGIIVFSIISVVAVITLREHNRDISTLLGIGCGTIILLSILDELFDVVYTFYNLAEKTGIDNQILTVFVKIVGVGYLTEFASDICIDADCKSIGQKISFAGKVFILLLSLPLLTNLIELIVELLP